MERAKRGGPSAYLLQTRLFLLLLLLYNTLGSCFVLSASVVAEEWRRNRRGQVDNRACIVLSFRSPVIPIQYNRNRNRQLLQENARIDCGGGERNRET